MTKPSVTSFLYACPALTLTLIMGAGCMEDLGLPEPDRIPVAAAHVLGMDGPSVTLSYTGAPVSVTLDASKSVDPDGSISAYRWLSGVPGSQDDADGGAVSAAHAARWVPAGKAPDWPDDVEQPQISLGEGDYTFVLWVVDDKGKVSDPSTVKITVSRPLDPAQQACLDSAAATAPRACAVCVCGLDDTCRGALAANSCNDTCWQLLGCVADKCPTQDMGCIVSSCSAFLGGATGATALGMCIVPKCSAECASQ
jgi:hypothetical protein